MNRRFDRVLFWFLAAVVVVLAGCRTVPASEAPPDIRYGQDVCDQCKMIISEENAAAAYWTSSGEARRFDDIGGMLLHHLEREEEVAAFWVHDSYSGDWLRAEEATIVMNAGVETPMGFGLAAFADPARADALAYGGEAARVLSFAELLAGLDSGAIVLTPTRGQGHAMDMQQP
jgi:copper chaperone NosL